MTANQGHGPLLSIFTKFCGPDSQLFGMRDDLDLSEPGLIYTIQECTLSTLLDLQR